MTPIRNGTWLEEQVFPETAWAVPGVIPEGCCILAGPPKVGKSYLLLGIALAAAGGGQVFGVELQRRPVLYLALEDSAARLQRRGRALLEEPLPGDFHFLTRMDSGDPMNLAREWLADKQDQKPMVIVDTLEMVRPRRSRHAYSDDYSVGAMLQTLLAPGGSVIAAHHTRKGAADDFIDDVSGTMGLSGSVDTIITLKRPRTDSAVRLSVTGRDVEEMVYSLKFNEGRWIADGEDLAAAAKRACKPQLGSKMEAVIALVDAQDRTTAADVVAALSFSDSTARQYLRRLADEHHRIVRIDTGVYGPVTVSQVSREQGAAGWTADDDPNAGQVDDIPERQTA